MYSSFFLYFEFKFGLLKAYFKNRYVLNAILILCWLVTAFIGCNGFFKSHDLLTVSVFDFHAPVIITVIFATITFAFPVVSLVVNVRIAKWLLLLSIVSYVFLILFDLHRLTPYMIVYLGIFTALIFLKYDSSILYTALLIIASGVYVFSGLHKLNIGFVTDVAPRLWFHSLPFNYSNTIGYVFAILEIAAGMLLLLPFTRKLSCILMTFMHLLIIWKLGPWKLDWNHIVIPWNILMITTLIFLYRKSALTKLKIGSAKPTMVTIGLFFWLLPGLSLITWVPENLSMMMYSGKSRNGYIVLNKKIERFDSYDQISDKGRMLISLQQYSMEERGIALHPEIKIYEKILRNFKIKYPETDSIYFSNPTELANKL